MQSALSLLQGLRSGEVSLPFSPCVKSESSVKSPSVADLRADAARILGLIDRLNRETPKLGYAEAAARLSRQIDKLAARCDLETGWSDPSDPFADEAILILRDALARVPADTLVDGAGENENDDTV